MNFIAQISMAIALALLSTSCARNNPVRYVSEASVQVPVRQTELKPIPYPASVNGVNLNFNQLLSFEYDCNKKNEQLEILEGQLKRRTFYKVDGVEGNELPDRISKQYYSLARYRIWNLRLGCRGSSVPIDTQLKLKNLYPNQLPEVVSRCYFEESTVSKISLERSNSPNESLVSSRKEVCTNYPLIANLREIHRGDVVDPGKHVDKNIDHVPNLRRWNGAIFQMVSKSEIHRNTVVKFTVVLMWNGSGWVVVDKF